MFPNVWSISTCFDIPDMFFLTSFKTNIATRLAQAQPRASFTTQLNSLVHRKGEILESTMSLMLISLSCYFQHLKEKIFQTTHTRHPHAWGIGLHVFKWVLPQENPISFAVLPFTNGVTQPLTRILQRHDIQVVNKPFKTLQQEFPSPKFRPSIEHQPNVICKIPCADCAWCYIGETGHCFETGKKEHKIIRNAKTCANGQTLRNMHGHSTIE